jgi:hypothetical protein
VGRGATARVGRVAGLTFVWCRQGLTSCSAFGQPPLFRGCRPLPRPPPAEWRSPDPPVPSAAAGRPEPTRIPQCPHRRRSTSSSRHLAGGAARVRAKSAPSLVNADRAVPGCHGKALCPGVEARRALRCDGAAERSRGGHAGGTDLVGVVVAQGGEGRRTAAEDGARRRDASLLACEAAERRLDLVGARPGKDSVFELGLSLRKDARL